MGNTPPGTPLRTLPGSSGFIQPKALNALGQVIGQTNTAPSRDYPAGLRHGFSWTGAGGIVDLRSIGFYRGSYDGRYSVTVFTSGFEDMSIVIDKIDNGAVITKNFALGRIGVLKGMVTDTNTSVPLAGAGVLVGEGVPVVGQPKTFKFSTHTDSAGKYSIMIEPHGAYKALAFQPGFNDSPPADITINTDDETTQNFALSKAMTGNITGIVQDADSGDLLENATVVATGVDPPSQSIMTDTSAGAYTLSNVPAGRYQVAAGARGYAEGNEIVKVIASQTVTASFELVRKRRR
jgi:hypothetical protein